VDLIDNGDFIYEIQDNIFAIECNLRSFCNSKEVLKDVHVVLLAFDLSRCDTFAAVISKVSDRFFLFFQCIAKSIVVYLRAQIPQY